MNVPRERRRCVRATAVEEKKKKREGGKWEEKKKGKRSTKAKTDSLSLHTSESPLHLLGENNELINGATMNVGEEKKIAKIAKCREHLYLSFL